MTEWRDIAGSPGYRVNDRGEVMSPRGRLLSPQPNGKYGYLRVQMGRERAEYVHRLVAAAFIGPVAGMDVEHRDGRPSNNSVENLMVVTHAENMRMQRLRKHHCSRGHSYAEFGFWVRGRRDCLECRRMRERANYRRKTKKEPNP